MNRQHLDYLASAQWGETLRSDLLPWLEQVGDLGEDVLEIGPGPGLTTDLLRARAAAVTAVEIDDELARALKVRLAQSNVEVVHGDARKLDLPTNRFSAATCFSMLHHMPTLDAQNQLFSELARVLRPGGIFAGVDSVDTPRVRAAHEDDTFVPVRPDTLAARLEAAGFAEVAVEQPSEHQVRFVARTQLMVA